ncbi:MAG: hypothetical protein EB060_03710 [Proteobacteria bacterium]|nr:hypothetical protein [Pseudomonadota bacterium]
MASFVFSGLKGKTTAFDPNNDSIIFTFADGEASRYTFLEPTSGTVQIFKTADMALGAPAIATLTGTSLNAFASNNLLFPGLGQVFIGDNTNAVPPAGSTNALDDGANTLNGTGGGDAMFGRGGNDTVLGNGGSDFMQGNAGQDSLVGDVGNDTIFGGADGDYINGGADDDSLQGNAGNDTIFTGQGANRVEGNEGDDSITGDIGNDSIHGGQGNDTIVSGSGFDTIDGGQGNDNIIVAPHAGETAIVLGNLGNDSISAATAAAGSAVQLFGNQGNDTILGSVNAEIIQGGQGADSIEGDKGNDTLYGNLDNDTLQGEEGDDLLIGGDGNDSIIGGTGNDTMLGGLGDDILQVDNVTLLTENDRIEGGLGRDTLKITPVSVNLSSGFFNNVTGVEVIQLQSGVIAIDDALVSRSDTGSLEIFASSTQAAPIVTVNASAVSPTHTVILHAADDEIFQLSGGATKVKLSDGGERVTGGIGADTITGGNLADTISGGLGADLLTGGTSSDQFRYADGTGSNVANGVDIITDFRSGADQIMIAAVEINRTVYTPRAGTADSLSAVAGLVNGAFNSGGTGNGDSQIINITGGALAGHKYLAIGCDSVAGFGANDLLIELAGTSESPSSTDITAIP